jgi:hypothetical protein
VKLRLTTHTLSASGIQRTRTVTDEVDVKDTSPIGQMFLPLTRAIMVRSVDSQGGTAYELWERA